MSSVRVLLFEGDSMPFTVKAEDGTERLYRIIVKRGGEAILVSEGREWSEAELIRAAFGEGVKLGKQLAKAKIVEQAGL